MSADEGADNARGFGIHDIGKDRLYEVLRKWLRPVDNKQALVHRPGPARAGPAYRSGLPKYMPPGTVILDQVSPDRENRYIVFHCYPLANVSIDSAANPILLL